MKNPKYLVAIMIGILLAVGMAIKSGENFGEDLKKNRLTLDDSTTLKIKGNTFTHETPPPKPMAPKWGSFKTEPQTTIVKAPVDKNAELLKTLAKKVADKLKNDKKKKKVAQKKKRGVKLIATNQSRVDRALRRLDDGWESKSQPVPVAFVVAKKPTPANGQEVTEEKLTLEDWKDLLLNGANPNATKQLLDAYQKNELGDKEWVFILAKEMIANNNPDIQAEGLKILDSVPSEQSFVVLVTQSQQEDSEEAKKEIEQSLLRYAQSIQHLSILENLVKSDEPLVQARAAELIQTSASIHLAQNGRGRRGAAQQTPAVPTARFESTLATLTALRQKPTTSEELKNTLDQTISTIRRYLGVTEQQQFA